MRDLFAPSLQGGARVRVFDWPAAVTPRVSVRDGSSATVPVALGWTSVRPPCG